MQFPVLMALHANQTDSKRSAGPTRAAWFRCLQMVEVLRSKCKASNHYRGYLIALAKKKSETYANNAIGLHEKIVVRIHLPLAIDASIEATRILLNYRILAIADPTAHLYVRGRVPHYDTRQSSILNAIRDAYTAEVLEPVGYNPFAVNVVGC